jgi:hypothetical protein
MIDAQYLGGADGQEAARLILLSQRARRSPKRQPDTLRSSTLEWRRAGLNKG